MNGPRAPAQVPGYSQVLEMPSGAIQHLSPSPCGRRWEDCMPGRAPAAPRCAAIVGPYLSGKTALMESLLFATGAISRKGTAKEGNTVGDSSPEAKARK